jgi:hypothetical protein
MPIAAVTGIVGLASTGAQVYQHKSATRENRDARTDEVALRREDRRAEIEQARLEREFAANQRRLADEANQRLYAQYTSANSAHWNGGPLAGLLGIPAGGPGGAPPPVPPPGPAPAVPPPNVGILGSVRRGNGYPAPSVGGRAPAPAQAARRPLPRMPTGGARGAAAPVDMSTLLRMGRGQKPLGPGQHERLYRG